MARRILSFCFQAGLWLAACTGALAQQVDGAGAKVDFVRDIRPILSRHCLACHGPDSEHREAGLRLDTPDGATAKLASGARAVVPGDVDESDLVFRITEEDDTVRMPPKKSGDQLRPDEIDKLTRWVAQGAVYAEHWAFVPPKDVQRRSNLDSKWARNAVDDWIEGPLARAGLVPSPEADRAALIRRLSLDLRGLPATMEEIQSFEHDDHSNAYERLVDRYLAEPGFGERWARVWLDLARYADSAGLGSDPLRPNMWRYRDWVIDAFNRNLPYNQFVVEQLAGDLLPNASLEQRVATAFHRNTMTNTEGGTDDEEFRVAAVKDRVDTTGQVFMGLTFGCAKCHNHKYDPLSNKEYYQMYAFFNQTADNDQPTESPTLPAPTAEQAVELARVEAKIAGLRRSMNQSNPELDAAQATWEAELGSAVAWTSLHPRQVKGENGTAYLVDDAGVVRAIGPNPAEEVISASSVVDLSRVTALRLESVPDPASPSRGAGRADDGNFVLSRIRLQTEPAGEAPSAPVGRYVRIELPGEQKLLSLAEVEVYSNGMLAAAGGEGEARQSSVDYGGVAARAVDGNKNGNFFEANSVTHTRVQNDPWWELKLSQSKPIDRIVVWNRTDGKLEGRLKGFRVSVLDDARKLVWQSERLEAPQPSLEVSTLGRREVPLGQAFADFSQSGFSVEQALNSPLNPNTGWAIAPRFREPHQAIFTTAQPLELERATRLIVQLEHKYTRPGFTLGQFRVAVTSDPNVTRRAALPPDVLAIIDTPDADRNDEQRQALKRHYRSISPLLQPMRDAIAGLEKSKPKPPPLPVMEELAAEKQRATRILVKGNFLDPGDVVSARVPQGFHPMAENAPLNRLGLARWIVDERNALTSRVAVNRVWAQLFGVGLVETEEDFGTQGEVPSHPELLDELSLWFQDSGWDMKALVRRLVTSATYRQSTRVSDDRLAVDPRNRLLSRMPRVRLEAEMVRDQALALSGLLRRKIGGPSVYPPQPDGLWQAAFNGERTWATSMGDDRWRRGIYTFWRRTVPYPSMATFDAPSRETCTPKRVRTNTPLQAFVTLNDPVFVEAAQALARRIAREGGETNAAKAAFGLELCLGRAATVEQVQVLVRLYNTELARFQTDTDAARALATDPLGPLPEGYDAADLAAWTSVANVLLNLDGVLTKG